LLSEMAAPDRETDPDQGPAPDQTSHAGPEEPDPPGLRQPDPEPDRNGSRTDAGNMDPRRTRPTPDPLGLLHLEREPDPPGLHQPDPDQEPRPNRGPLLGRLLR